jgi:hypothetical protein
VIHLSRKENIKIKPTIWIDMKYLLIVLIFLFFFNSGCMDDDPVRYHFEVETLLKSVKYDSTKDVIVFTGSSSIRLWNNIDEYFSDINFVNTGFGGSHMSDLLFYHQKLILNFFPKKVFIYEGDNDLHDGKSPVQILSDAMELVQKIRHKLPLTQIIFISVKPSPNRWNLREKYLELNMLLKIYASEEKWLGFVDTWNLMLDENLQPKSEIFNDGLHMNSLGYNIWASEIEKFLFES